MLKFDQNFPYSIVCLNCKSKVRCCAVCSHEHGNIRRLALEKVTESLELPCRYQILVVKTYSLTIAGLGMSSFANCAYATHLMLELNAPSRVIYTSFSLISRMITRLMCIMGVLSTTVMSNPIRKK